MDKVYAVHVGSFKSVVHSTDGRQQILGFHVPGELMGLENLVARRHAIAVVALEESEACEVNVRDLELAARDVSTLQHQLHCLMGDRLARAQQDQFNLGSAHAEERLARFLLDFSQRLKARGLSSWQLTLHMTREEMASYLGLTMETVSRLLSRFHRDGLIKLSVRELQITDREGLAALIAPLEP
jgi:CRP/FNR family transcriptional regulator